MARPQACTVEIEFAPGVWTAVSSRVRGEVKVRGGRSTAYEDTSPSTLSVLLDNADGALTPDNPLSAYYPHVTENIGIRASVTSPSSTVYRLFTGFVDSLTPAWPSGHYSSAVVAIEASDAMARANRCVLRSDWVEQCLQTTSVGSATWVDVWPMAGDTHAGRLGNVGDGVGTRISATLKRQKSSPRGSYSLGESVEPTIALLDGCLVLDPAEIDATPDRRGWVLQVRTSQAPGTIQWWVRLPPDMSLVNSAGVAWPSMVIAQGIATDGGGDPAFTLTAAGGLLMGLTPDFPTDYGTVLDPAVDGISLLDGEWHLITGTDLDDLSGSSWRVDEGAWKPMGFYLSGLRGMTFGGGSSTFENAASMPMRGCVPMQIGPVVFLEDTESSGIAMSYADPTGARGVISRATDYGNYLMGHGVTPTEGDATGDDDQQVVASPTSGRSVGEVAQILAGTIGGAYWCDADGVLQFADGETLRGPAVEATVVIEEDDDSSGFEWRRAVDERPTRVTATSAGGDATVIDDDAEALGARRDESVETCALDSGAAQSAAKWRMSMAEGLRLRKVGADLVTAKNDLWALLSVLEPFTRMRVTGLPSTQLGVTYADVHIVGWDVSVSHESVQVVMDTVPAALESRVGTGRCSAGDSELNASLTSSATTVVIKTNSGPTWTTDASAYPMDITVNGERVTLASAPGGSTSPQTFTGVTRGVAPSVARAHASAEDVDVFDALIVTI